MEKKPLISIITVCYNSEKTIKDTIESILNQTYKNIEYVLVDGKSTDSTVDIIKSYTRKMKQEGIIYRWVTESDSGIYDAMNKGIKMITGEWVNFMNSGDSFIGDAVIETVVKTLSIEDDIIYGDIMVEYDSNNLKRVKPNDLNDFYKTTPFCHQACFTSSKLMKKEEFNLNYRLCADFDFFYKMYLEKKNFKYIYEVIALFDVYGVSSDALSVYKENRKIVLSRKKKYILYYNIIYFYVLMRIFFKDKLPVSLVRKIQMLK